MSMFGEGTPKQALWEEIRYVMQDYDLTPIKVVIMLAEIIQHLLEE